MAGNQPKAGFRVSALQEIFAMPLLALIEADATAAQTFVDFIKKYGFKPDPNDPNGYGELIMISFRCTRPVGNEGVKTVVVEVPLLSLIPLPSLAIKDANVKFGLDVVGMLEEKPPLSSDRQDQLPPRRPSPLGKKMMVRVARAPSAAPGQPPEFHVDMKVDVNVGQTDLPNGILQMLNLIGQSTSDRPPVGPKLTVQADKDTLARGETAKVTVTAYDSLGKVVDGTRVTINDPADQKGLLDYPSHVTTDANGQATFDVTVAKTTAEKAHQILVLSASIGDKEFPEYAVATTIAFNVIPTVGQKELH